MSRLLNIQKYKGIALGLINRDCRGCKAKRFTLNGTNQNVWIPNKHLEKDGTIKEGENIDYVFKKGWRQLDLSRQDEIKETQHDAYIAGHEVGYSKGLTDGYDAAAPEKVFDDVLADIDYILFRGVDSVSQHTFDALPEDGGYDDLRTNFRAKLIDYVQRACREVVR
mgnify:CR=1 FL=1